MAKDPELPKQFWEKKKKKRIKLSSSHIILQSYINKNTMVLAQKQTHSSMGQRT